MKTAMMMRMGKQAMSSCAQKLCSSGILPSTLTSARSRTSINAGSPTDGITTVKTSPAFGVTVISPPSKTARCTSPACTLARKLE